MGDYRDLDMRETQTLHERRSPKHRFLAALTVTCVLGVGVVPTRALAQSDSDRATARALAEEGYNALKAKRYDIAEDRFRRADALVHAPTLVVDDGRALIGLGRYLDAQEKFELVLREGVAENAPVVWKSAVAEAEKLLEEVKPKVAWLTISIPNVSHPHVAISGRPISDAALGVKFALNPGAQTVEVTADGYQPKTQSITLGEGSEQTLELTLDPAPSRGAPTTVSPVVLAPPRKDTENSSSAAYITLGVGTAGIVVGSVTGFLALHKRSDLKTACVDGKCPQSMESTLNSYHSLGLVSGIGFGLGLAGLGTGFFLLGTGGHSNTQAKTAHGVHVQVGTSSIELQGSF